MPWRVLDPVTGLVMCELIIDSQPFNNYVKSYGTDEYDNTAYWGDAAMTHYANDYAESSLRQWLNAYFLYMAFSPLQHGIIAQSVLDNSAFDTILKKTQN